MMHMPCLIMRMLVRQFRFHSLKNVFTLQNLYLAG